MPQENFRSSNAWLVLPFFQIYSIIAHLKNLSSSGWYKCLFPFQRNLQLLKRTLKLVVHKREIRYNVIIN